MAASNNKAYYCLEYYVRWAHETDIDDGNLFPCEPGECITDRIGGAASWQPTKHVSGVELGSGGDPMKFSGPADHQRSYGCSMRPWYRRTPASVLVDGHILEDRMRNIHATIDQSKPSLQHRLGTGVFAGPVGLRCGLTRASNITAAVGTATVRVDMIEVEAGRGHDLSQAE
jgi:hypothetical protein